MKENKCLIVKNHYFGQNIPFLLNLASHLNQYKITENYGRQAQEEPSHMKIQLKKCILVNNKVKFKVRPKWREF